MKHLLFCVVVSFSSVSFAGVSPGGLVDPTHANMSRSRIVAVDSLSPFHRTRGDEIFGSSFSGGSSHSSSDFWSIGNAYSIDMFRDEDSLDFDRSGSIELNDLGASSRMQGIESQNMSGSARVLEPVSYTLSVVVTPTFSELSGDVVATLGFDFSVIMLGTSITIINEGLQIDLTSNTDEYVFEFSGILDPGNSLGLVDFSSASILSTVIDEPGELVHAGYTMSVDMSFEAVPAPSSLAAIGVLGLMGTRRRR